jgi:hypothetical protein
VLYALLGAVAYDLRDFSERVRRRSYYPSYSSVARIIAASTAGAIISLFNDFGQSIALSPLALAFLVGYGVEAFSPSWISYSRFLTPAPMPTPVRRSIPLRNPMPLPAPLQPAEHPRRAARQWEWAEQIKLTEAPHQRATL